MGRFSLLRVIAALSIAVLALGMMAAPVGAATPIVMCSGTCGNYVAGDTDFAHFGAQCTYETASYDLDTIVVNAPQMYGPYVTKTEVQWKFSILRSTNFGASWTSYYKSGWQTAKASKSAPADAIGHGFARRTWLAPDPNPTGYFKVRLLLRWKNAAGSVVGNAKVEYDYYQGKWNGSTDNRSDYCLQDW